MTLEIECPPRQRLRETVVMPSRVGPGLNAFEVTCHVPFIAPYRVVVSEAAVGNNILNPHAVRMFRNGKHFEFGSERGEPLWIYEGDRSGPVTCADGDVLRIELPFDVPETKDGHVGVAIMGHVLVDEPSIDDLIGRSSLGSPEAVALRRTADPETVKKALAHADLLSKARSTLPEPVTSFMCDACGEAVAFEKVPAVENEDSEVLARRIGRLAPEMLETAKAFMAKHKLHGWHVYAVEPSTTARSRS